MKVKKVALKGYYNLAGEYLPFADNPHHGKTYDNVSVSIETKFKATNFDSGIMAIDYVKIEGCEPIECELVGAQIAEDGTLLISICQDWG